MKIEEHLVNFISERRDFLGDKKSISKENIFNWKKKLEKKNNYGKTLTLKL